MQKPGWRLGNDDSGERFYTRLVSVENAPASLNVHRKPHRTYAGERVGSMGQDVGGLPGG